MTPIVAFILGLLIGWLIEWVIDVFYYRRKRADSTERVDESARRRVTELEQEVASYKNQLSNLQAEAAVVAERQEVVSRPTERSFERIPVVDQPEPEQTPRRDALEEIPGISAETARTLNEDGIYTFADLGGLRPNRLRGIVGESLGAPGVEVDMIRQARLLAGTMRQVDDLEIIDGIGPVIAKILYNAGIFTFADLSTLSQAELREIVGERIQRLSNEEKILSQARRLAEHQD